MSLTHIAETFILIVFSVFSVFDLRKPFILIVFSVFSVFSIFLVEGSVEMHCRQMGIVGGLSQRPQNTENTENTENTIKTKCFRIPITEITENTIKITVSRLVPVPSFERQPNQSTSQPSQPGNLPQASQPSSQPTRHGGISWDLDGGCSQ